MTAWEAILGGLIGVLAGMLANELFAWQPRLARWILEKAVKRTPEAMQARLREEWQADLATIPGKLSGVVFAAHLLWKARSIEEGTSIKNPPKEWLLHVQGLMVLKMRVAVIVPALGEPKIAKPLIGASNWIARRSWRRLEQGRYRASDRFLLGANSYLLIRYGKRLPFVDHKVYKLTAKVYEK